MTVLQFLASLADSLAWPVVVLVLAWKFHVPLVALLKALRLGKVGNTEFEFEQGVKEAEVAAADLLPAPTEASERGSVREAIVHPRAAVLEAWMELEEKAIGAAFSRGVLKPTARRWPEGDIRGLQKAKLLKDQHQIALDQLRELRNQAAHHPDFRPKPDAVLSYVTLAQELGAELDRIAAINPQ